MLEIVHRPRVVGTSIPFPLPGDTASVGGSFGPRLIRVIAADYDSTIVVYQALSADLGCTLGRESLQAFLETWRAAELVPLSGLEWGTFRQYLEVRASGQVPAEENGFTDAELKKFAELYCLIGAENAKEESDD